MSASSCWDRSRVHGPCGITCQEGATLGGATSVMGICGLRGITIKHLRIYQTQEANPVDCKFWTVVYRFSDVESRISTLESQISDLESRFLNFDSRISNLEPRISNLESRTSNLCSRIWNLGSVVKCFLNFWLERLNFGEQPQAPGATQPHRPVSSNKLDAKGIEVRKNVTRNKFSYHPPAPFQLPTWIAHCIYTWPAGV